MSDLARDLIDELKRLEVTAAPAPWVSHKARMRLWSLCAIRPEKPLAPTKGLQND